MNSMPSGKKAISLCLLVLAAACGVAPAEAGGLLGGVGGVAAGATGTVGGAVGLGAGGSPMGGLGGGLTGSGKGLLGATLSSNGLQPGAGAGLGQALSGAPGRVDALRPGRAWGTFEDAKGSLKGKAGSAKDRASLLTSGKLDPAANVLGGSGRPADKAKAGSKKSLTEGFTLSRSFELPEMGQPLGQAQAKGQGAAAGSASSRHAKVAASADGSAEVRAKR